MDTTQAVVKGNLGQPPGGFPKHIVTKALKGEKPNLDRPGKNLDLIDLEKTRQELSDKLDGMKIDDEDLNGYLMYPKVFLDYMERHLTYGPVRTLPTKTFFYGMNSGDEISLEIDPGKTLEIRMQAIGETDENGEVKVFFELNGQPRVIRVPFVHFFTLVTTRIQSRLRVKPRLWVLSSLKYIYSHRVISLTPTLMTLCVIIRDTGMLINTSITI